ncbi:MAG TPA: hypothetical protein VJV77_16965 [Casimicrobiaceae bacterium]|nr:hypothetical protein [Casimicrobiaceae bacterium]
MKRIPVLFLALSLVLFVAPVQASFHLFRIDQVFSNADGTIQYVVMREVTGSDGEGFWTGHQLETTSLADAKQEFTFRTDLPSQATASRKVLIATSGFAALNLVTPDYTIPNGFIPVGGGKLDYADGTDQINYPALPTDGATAITRNGTPVAATPTNFAGVTATLNLGPPAGVSPDLNQHGLTGSWFEPATSGQGIEVEFFPNLVAQGTAFVQGAWFTFDVTPAGGADRQRWYTFSGNGQSGAANVPVAIFRNVGGNFNAPPVTSATAVGTGTLSFSDCANGAFAYTFTDGSNRSGTIPLLRLLPNVTCAAGTAPGTNADFALSGNWLDPATSGQGFVFDVNPNLPFMFATWYTYAPAGQTAGAAGQRWFTAQGSYTPGSRSMTLPLFATTGGVFDQTSNPGPSTNQVGTATVTFASCTSAQVQFNFTAGSSAGQTGTITLSRIGPVPPGCTQAASMTAPVMPGYPGYGPM